MSERKREHDEDGEKVEYIYPDGDEFPDATDDDE